MTDKKDDALKLALEALEFNCVSSEDGEDLTPAKIKKAITAIRAALAIQNELLTEQDDPDLQDKDHELVEQHYKQVVDSVREVFDAKRKQPAPPASKPWVGLSTIELDEIDAPIRERGHATIAEIYRAIESKLKDKNGY